LAREDNIVYRWHAVCGDRCRCRGKPDRTPAKKQRRYSSGQKKRHTPKAQLVVAQQTREVLCAAVGKGREHDWILFKRSQIAIAAEIESVADKGYQGRKKRPSNSHTPQKKPRGGELSKQEKQQNRALSRRRVVCAHVRGKLKVCSLLGEQYRNRRRRCGLRLHLLASLSNLDLQLPR
jgi:hypothetical protein